MNPRIRFDEVKHASTNAPTGHATQPPNDRDRERAAARSRHRDLAARLGGRAGAERRRRHRRRIRAADHTGARPLLGQPAGRRTVPAVHHRRARRVRLREQPAGAARRSRATTTWCSWSTSRTSPCSRAPTPPIRETLDARRSVPTPGPFVVLPREGTWVMPPKGAPNNGEHPHHRHPAGVGGHGLPAEQPALRRQRAALLRPHRLQVRHRAQPGAVRDRQLRRCLRLRQAGAAQPAAGERRRGRRSASSSGPSTRRADRATTIPTSASSMASTSPPTCRRSAATAPPSRARRPSPTG